MERVQQTRLCLQHRRQK